MAKGVVLSESSDSGILNVEASMLTDITSFLDKSTRHTPGYQPGFDLAIMVLVATYKTDVHMPRLKQARISYPVSPLNCLPLCPCIVIITTIPTLVNSF
jgi:hypothetical protein